MLYLSTGLGGEAQRNQRNVKRLEPGSPLQAWQPRACEIWWIVTQVSQPIHFSHHVHAASSRLRRAPLVSRHAPRPTYELRSLLRVFSTRFLEGVAKVSREDGHDGGRVQMISAPIFPDLPCCGPSNVQAGEPENTRWMTVLPAGAVSWKPHVPWSREARGVALVWCLAIKIVAVDLSHAGGRMMSC